MENFVTIIISFVFVLFVFYIMVKGEKERKVITINDNCRFEYELIIDTGCKQYKIHLYSDWKHKSINELIRHCSNIERTRSDFIYHRDEETIFISNTQINMITMTSREVEIEKTMKTH